MKLLLVAAASSVHVLRWANAFVERGIDTHLATQHGPLPGFAPGVHIHRLPYSGALGYFRNRGALRRLVAQVRPDLLNVHYASGYGTLVGGLGDTPVVLNVWGSDVFDFPDKGPLHRWLLIRNLRSADHLVSTSRAMAEQVRRLMRADVPISIVPFGVDTSVFKPGAPRTSPDALVVGTVKTLAPTYGIDILLRAFALVPPRINDREVRLHIVGKGPQEGELRALAQSLGIADRVEFTGPVAHAQVPEQLARMDVFAALSRSESFGVAVIEASACGLPVVVSNVGGLPEVVADGVTGTLVPPDDPVASANAFGTLLSNTMLRERMGAEGRALMQRTYDWQGCVDRMITVYQEVINARSRA